MVQSYKEQRPRKYPGIVESTCKGPRVETGLGNLKNSVTLIWLRRGIEACLGPIPSLNVFSCAQS